MTPKEECEELLNALLPFAVDQIKKHGEFYPFGGVMLENGEISLTSVDTGEEHPDSTDMIDRLTGIHNNKAGKAEIKASGICWNATIALENGAKSDAIIVSLEDRDNYSVIVGQPYRIGFLKKVNFGSIFAQEGKYDVFG